MRNILISVFIFVLSSYCFSDSWSFPKELMKESFVFGGTEIVRIIDTRNNQSYPEYKVLVKYQGKEEAIIKNLTFDMVATFDQGSYILGVSNSGLSSFAYFILSKSGALIRAVRHSQDIDYCKQSATIRREWINSENLEISEVYDRIENEFEPDNPYIFLKEVQVLDCHGNKVNIFEI